MVSGGAPLNPDVGIFFHSLGPHRAPGLRPDRGGAGDQLQPARSAGIKMDTVGPPLKNTEVRIAEDGEILVRGELVMKGYWRNPAQTEKALIDGWLHTGDVGHIDEAGRIVITDRKKDLIVNDKGDNVSPQKVEGMLTLQPEILQAMVVGDRRPYLVGLLVPDPEWTAEWAQGGGQAEGLRRAARRSRLSPGAVGGGRPGQCRPVGDREGAPLHPRRRAVHRPRTSSSPRRSRSAATSSAPPMASGWTRCTRNDPPRAAKAGDPRSD